MPRHTRRDFLRATGAATIAAAGVTGTAAATDRPTHTRFATYNVTDLGTAQVQSSGDEQAAAAARVIQELRPDVLVLNELTNNLQQGKATDTPNAVAFVENYLSEPQAPHLEGIDYPHHYQPTVNTGVPSGMDLNNDGTADVTRDGPYDFSYANDAYGFGRYPGQYGMAILSQHPIDESGVRSFRKFLWKDMPDNNLPTDEDTAMYLSESEVDEYRLSSKTHLSVPVEIDGETVHALMAHPTPPVFDGPGNFNGKRCHDEVRLLSDIAAGEDYVYDDEGTSGGLPADASYVLLGDMNARPNNAESLYAADKFLLDPERFDATPLPKSPHGAKNGNPLITQNDGFKLDYALPSPDLGRRDAAVVWPVDEHAKHGLLTAAETASDHRLVRVDVEV